MSFKGRKNIYRCPACGGETITIDVDEGTTPMFLACRASGDIGNCKGRAVSSMYEVDPDVVPAWEWYLPSLNTARRKGPDVLDHVRRGGLLLRPLAAAKKAHLLHVPCLVRPRGREEVRVLTQIAENRDRRAMSPYEEAIALGQLHKLGMTTQAIGEAIGMQPSNVGTRLQLLAYPQAVTTNVHFRRIGLTDALAIPLELARDVDGRTLSAACRRGGGHLRKWVREQLAERASHGQVIEKRKRYETFNLDSDLIDEVRVAANAAELKVVEWIRQAIRAQLDLELMGSETGGRP